MKSPHCVGRAFLGRFVTPSMALKITAGNRTVAGQRGIVRARRNRHKARAAKRLCFQLVRNRELALGWSESVQGLELLEIPCRQAGRAANVDALAQRPAVPAEELRDVAAEAEKVHDVLELGR